MFKFRPHFTTFALFALALIAMVFTMPTTKGQRRPSVRPTTVSPQGLQFRLSEGAEAQDRPQALATPIAQLLDANDTAALLKRLAPFKAEADDEKPFAFRERSLPAPRAGQTVTAAFPPLSNTLLTEKPATAPLEILRYAPEGEVPLAPHLSITFSQPMVAVTSNDDLAAGQVPVKLSPQPAGRWRWLGTKTLLFAPDKRFPMATVYTVEIPANTKSVWGNALAATKRFTFSTPALTVKTAHPQNTPQRRDPLLFLEFDQRINKADIVEKLRLNAANQSFNVRLATEAEIKADQQVNQFAQAAQPDRWLAFKPNELLPAATNCIVTLPIGTPSAEGPRRTEKAYAYNFQTYAPLTLQRHQCGYQERCEPFMPFTLSFNNPLDMTAFEKSWIRITPELPGAQIIANWNSISIQGATKGRTTYTVTINTALKDQFGQTLEKPVTVAFNVLDAAPSLAAAAENFAVLDPNAPAKFSAFTVNHAQLKTTLYAVGPEHWGQFAKYLQESGGGYGRRGRDWKPLPAIGRLASSKTINVATKPDELIETAIDLTPALTNSVGQMVLAIEAVQPPKNEYERRAVYVWLQATQIGLDAFVDSSELVAWASSLKDGKPLANVEIELRESSIKAGEKNQADAKGLARFALSAQGKRLLVARAGKDVAMLPENFHGSDEQYNGWQKGLSADRLAWHVFDDRGLYKPGEDVRIKGWVRHINGGPRGDVSAASLTLVPYRLMDSRGNEISKGSLSVNAAGGFDTKLSLPKTMNLGAAHLLLGNEASQQQHHHPIQVQEFRRPEYEVTVKSDAGPHYVKGAANLTVAANYYAGGGLPNAEVNWNVNAQATNYTPPNRGDFTFGAWTPWWVMNQAGAQSNNQQFQGRTDASGKHTLRIDFDAIAPPRATSITASANVADVNRQSLGGSTSLLVHPAELYVGLRSPRTFVQQGEPLLVDAIVTDLDGKAITGREIKMQAVQLAWQFDKGEWKQVESNPQDCTVRSNDNTVQCRFTPKEGGTYRVRATILDDRERPNQSELTLWVAGGKQPPSRDLAQEKVELIPNQKEYKAGETAEILVQAPFANAEAVLTLRRAGLVRTERFTINGASHTLRVPIEDAFTPNLHVQVDLVGAAERTGDDGQPRPSLPKRPAFASGALNLSIPPASRKLTATVTPRDKALEPGGTTNVDVELRDAAGKPVPNGEVALVVVDEAVLALTGYKLGDPLASFYPQRGDDVRNHHLREKVALANPDLLIGKLQNGQQVLGLHERDVAGFYNAQNGRISAAKAAPMAMRTMADESNLALLSSVDQKNDQIQVRTNFDALAFFAASLPTDANGRASVTVKLPDNLTRYRVMAVAVAGEKQFGTGEAAITARLPLMARPSAPRFLNFGDRLELPVVVQNQTDNPMTVDVVVRATNAELTAFVVPPSGGGLGNANQPPKGGTTNAVATNAAGRRVTVPPNDRVEVRFPAAAVKPGTARFQIGVSSGKWADAAEVSLPVWTPATTEAFAVYGELDNSVFAQPVKAPSDAVKQFGGLEVTTSSTQLQALTDAVIYLSNYPYECAEQISSRILAIAALRDVLAAFDAKGLPKADVLEAGVKRDIERLRGMQAGNGGFGFWTRNDETWPYISIHVAHALTRAKAKGFDVPKEMTDKSQQYLRNIESYIPSWYGIEARRSLIAYALFTRTLMNDRDAAKARSLIAQAGSADKLPLESLGWLLPVLSGEANSKLEVAAIRRHFANRVEETAGNAHFTTNYGDGAYLMLHSNRRADGIILAALIGDDPTNDLIAKLARGLLAHRKAAGPNAGGWENTQENAWVLLALDRYFNTYEKVTPNFIARAWLGDGYAGEHAFKGRTTERSQINVPMSYLMSQSGSPNLTLAKEGAGRMYYRIGMQYAPTNLQLKAADYGFTVTRVYEAIDNPNDVRRQEDGTWRIKAGAQVRVRLTMVAPARRYHVALVDPLPAGFEALNPALAVTGAIPRDPQAQTSNRWWWWQRTWYEHQNLRDERVEAFASLLWEGVHTYSYVARATTPGVFVVPPTKAEEMYHPETYGRGASERVIVE